MKKTSLATHCL